jgi:WD40 repeat protein
VQQARRQQQQIIDEQQQQHTQQQDRQRQHRRRRRKSGEPGSEGKHRHRHRHSARHREQGDRQGQGSDDGMDGSDDVSSSQSFIVAGSGVGIKPSPAEQEEEHQGAEVGEEGDSEDSETLGEGEGEGEGEGGREKGGDEDTSPQHATKTQSAGDPQRQHVRQQARLSLTGHRGAVSCIDVSVPTVSAVGEDSMQGDEDISPLAKLVVSGGVDGTIRVWDWVSGKSIAVLPFAADTGQHQADVSDMSVVGASAGAGAMAQAAGATTAESSSADTSVAQTSEAVTCVALQCGGRQLVAGGANGTLRTWKIGGGAEGVAAVRTIRQAHSGAITCLHAGDRREGHLADPSRLVTASADHTIRVWDLRARRPQVHCLRGHADAITALTVDAQLWLAVSGSRDQSVRVWDLRSGRAVRTAAEAGGSTNGHFGAVHCIALDGAGKGRFLSGARDSSLKVWDTQSPLSSSTSATSVISAAAAVSTTTEAAAASTSGGSGSGQLACVATLRGHTRAITCLDVRQHEGANGSSRAVSGSSDGTLRVWDFHRQRCHATCIGHQAPVTTVMWVAHRRILSGSTDGTLRLWDAASGFNLCTYEGHRGGVTAVRFDAGGIVSSSKDGIVRIFDGSAFN